MLPSKSNYSGVGIDQQLRVFISFFGCGDQKKKGALRLIDSMGFGIAWRKNVPRSSTEAAENCKWVRNNLVFHRHRVDCDCSLIPIVVELIIERFKRALVDCAVFFSHQDTVAREKEKNSLTIINVE